MSARLISSNRPRVLILGSGWGGNNLARKLDKSLFDVRVVSPTNHFLFTPLLPSTAVGTLEFRAVQEPIRTIKGLSEYYQAKARSLDTKNKTITCEDTFSSSTFDLPYDYLILATGSKTNTFGTPGVEEREGKDVFFLKHLKHARAIRNRILACFERASNSTLSEQEKINLCSFVVVGGGATSCEFTSELSDFIRDDVARWYPELAKRSKISLIEASPKILGSFDAALVDYYQNNLIKRGVNLKLGSAIKEIQSEEVEGGISRAVLSNGDDLPFGALVWSAGLAQVRFIENASLPRHQNGRLVVDKYLRVPTPECEGSVFALGDCAAILDHQLPPTASVAEQQSSYLAACFNQYYKEHDISCGASLALPGPVRPSAMPFKAIELFDKLFTPTPHFRYVERGAMASMGFGGGIADLSKTGLPGKNTVSGWAAFVAWRGAYLTKQLSVANMILVPMFWFKCFLFGRDISRF